MIKHISFDAWNTLISSNPKSGDVRREYFYKNINASTETIDHAYKKTKFFIDDCAEKFGCDLSSKAMDIMRCIMDCGFEGFYTDPKQSDQSFMQSLQEVYSTETMPVINNELVNELKNLKHNGISLSICSNTTFIFGSTLRKFIFDKMDVFDFMLFSDEEMVAKPHKIMYDTVIKRTTHINKNISPKEIMHVGDNTVCDGLCVDNGIKYGYVENPEHLLNKLKSGVLYNA